MRRITAGMTGLSEVLVVVAAAVIYEIVRPALTVTCPPDFLPLCAILWFACRDGAMKGVLMGIVAGLICDLLGETAVGVHVGPMALMGFMFGKAYRHLWLWSIPVRAAVLAVIAILYIPATQIFVALSGMAITWNFITLRNLTIANGICVFSVLIFLSQRRDRSLLPAR